MPHADSPLLTYCPPGLPRAAYLDAGWFAREQAAIWRRCWVHAGRLDDLPPGTIRPLTVAGAGVVLTRLASGEVQAWHNACRHRGAEICAAEARLGRLISCPYHAWSYAAEDGRLVSTGFATPTADFDRAAHGLKPVQVRLWAGSVFLSLAETPPAFAPDGGTPPPHPSPSRGEGGAGSTSGASLGQATGDTEPSDPLAHWPMARLVTGHRETRDLACNWKVFWENYNECLHCPGIHKGLSARVPIYAEGLMAANERADWAPGSTDGSALEAGAVSWTADGLACGPTFAGLTEAERERGATFVTLYPSAYIVAHVDHARVVTLTATGPETTRLTAEWLFPPETLAQPGFDAAAISRFALTVIDEDGAASEMNQRGIRSPSFERATLMPQEFDIHRFHTWVLAALEEGGSP
jgi:Rieske 2Fe-2S family protein